MSTTAQRAGWKQVATTRRYGEVDAQGVGKIIVSLIDELEAAVRERDELRREVMQAGVEASEERDTAYAERNAAREAEEDWKRGYDEAVALLRERGLSLHKWHPAHGDYDVADCPIGACPVDRAFLAKQGASA